MRSVTAARVARRAGRACILCIAMFLGTPPVLAAPRTSAPPEGSESGVFDDAGEESVPPRERSAPVDETDTDAPSPQDAPAEPAPGGPAGATAARARDTIPERLRVPGARSIAEAEQLVREAFGDARAVRGRAGGLALARKLLEQGQEAANDDPATRYVLLRDARDLAAAAGDLAVAMAAAEEMVAAFRVKRAATKLAAVPPAGKSADAAELTRVLVAISNDGIAEEDWAAATKAASLAAVAAGRVRDDKPLGLRARAQPGAVARGKKLAAAAADARKALDANPDDPKANLVLGRYLCLIRGNWTAGVPRLAKSADPTLRDLARRELAVPKDAAQMAALAADWWSAAERAAKEDAGPFRGRAAHWYLEALPGLEGVPRSLAEKRVSAVQQGGQTANVNLLPHMKPQGCTVTRARDGVALTEGEHGRIVTPNEFRAPMTVEVIANTTGDTRLYAGDTAIWVLNWQERPTELKFQDPVTRQLTSLPGKGEMADEKWVAIRWVVEADQASLFVDGELRAKIKGDYSGWAGPVGIGPSHGSTVTVRSLTVTAGAAPKKNQSQP